MTGLEVAVVVIIAIGVLVVGFGIGILVARPLARWLARDDEEPHDL
jgi:hypothetical protein